MNVRLAIGVIAALTPATYAAAAWDHASGCWEEGGAVYCPRPPLYVNQQADRAHAAALADCRARFGITACEEQPSD